MSVTDPIADMLNHIRNAHIAGAPVVELPHSKLKGEIARILKREGYIADYTAEGGAAKKKLRVFLKYNGQKKPTIRGLKRVSKPGLRRYVPSQKIPRVLGGMGITILSTPAGILGDREARKLRVGGEVLCQVW